MNDPNLNKECLIVKVTDGIIDTNSDYLVWIYGDISTEIFCGMTGC